MKKKKCVLYIRVSKADESQNPANQLEPLRKLAETLDLEVVNVFKDEASGGNSNRPQFQEMLKQAKSRRFDSILIWSLDRFSREGISNTLHYLEELKKAGVAIKSLQESWLDTSDEGMGQLLIAIMSWIAGRERKIITERTRAGLATAKANGKTLGRPAGKRDSKKRRLSGYYLRYASPTKA